MKSVLFPIVILLSVILVSPASSNEFLRIGLGSSTIDSETEAEISGLTFFSEDSMETGMLHLSVGTDRERNRTFGQLNFTAFEDSNIVLLGLGHDWMFTSRPFQPYLGVSGGLIWLNYTEDYDDGQISIALEGEGARSGALGGQFGLYYQVVDDIALDLGLQFLGTSLETEIQFPGMGTVNNEIVFVGNVFASISLGF